MNKSNLFTITHRESRGLARCGVVNTAHGSFETPCFVPVGTQGSIKSLSNEEISLSGSRIFFINTYHMMLRPGVEVIERAGGLHSFIGWRGPLITDSGGFQVFSLGREKLGNPGGEVKPQVKIGESGVEFKSHWDGKNFTLTPQSSMEIQHIMGADIIVAFDDCTSYPVSHETAQKSLKRTMRWADESLAAHEKLLKKVKLGTRVRILGSIQGSVYEDLRRKAASEIAQLPFDGFAIGGVAVGETKEEMENVVSWVVPHLPEEKMRHLLGVGEIDDIFMLVKLGVDTFDCVGPTRLARMGHFFIQNNKLDIQKRDFASDFSPLIDDCLCTACKGYNRAYIHHLFRVKELLAYRLLTIHNVYFIHELMGKIRESLKEGTLDRLEKEYL